MWQHDMMTEVGEELFKDSVSAASLSTSMKMIRGGELSSFNKMFFNEVVIDSSGRSSKQAVHKFPSHWTSP